ncbi:Uncharacterised protein [Oligella urethralis]|uniref:Uncharacterized protein n=1 Tax=Oligella urethralis TaxID=90245 RepID=A0A2X1UV63_9BURK|nr:Uncharacterised protein [Oligella urethralis]SUA61336.1 Uncharacterised protein [Oligella urethralis]SUA67721.1 Uncharacterised protein [Oligella urethralis]
MVVFFSGVERAGAGNGADCSAEEFTFKSLLHWYLIAGIVTLTPHLDRYS